MLINFLLAHYLLTFILYYRIIKSIKMLNNFL